MIKFQDLTALYTLIGVPVSLVPVALGCFYKSKAEDTVNGIVYETALRQMENTDTNTINEVDSEVDGDFVWESI